MRFPPEETFLLPSEIERLRGQPQGVQGIRHNNHWTPDDTTRKMDVYTARMLLLNFLVSKTLVLHLASPDEMGGRHARLRGLSTHSMKALAKGGKAFDNGKMLATVIYWVARAAISPESEGEASRLPDGDGRVLGETYEDREYGHVFKELRRTGWIDQQRERLCEICDKGYFKGLGGLCQSDAVAMLRGYPGWPGRQEYRASEQPLHSRATSPLSTLQ